MKPASQLPWKVAYGAGDARIANDFNTVVTAGGRIPEAVVCTADCAYIVHAANLYPELVEALGSCAVSIERVRLDPRDVFALAESIRVERAARAVLAKCEGEVQP